VALLFSASYIISKVALRHFEPLAFGYLRVLGSGALLGASYRYWSRASAPLSRGDRLQLMLYALLGVVLNQSLFIAGLALTSAHEAAILISSVPAMTLLAAVALRRETATWIKVMGMTVAGIGAVLVVIERGNGVEGSIAGNLLILLNSLSYSFYLVLSKRAMTRLTPTVVITHMFVYGAAMMLPIALPSLLRQNWQDVPASAWVALAVVIAGPTVAAYTLNAWALARAESSVVAAYTYLQPATAAALAALFLGEQISGYTLAAGALIIGGVYLTTSTRFRSL
jgi:drug/metabolite transporter (DMT)-like permease